jgi:hypothetical protein
MTGFILALHQCHEALTPRHDQCGEWRYIFRLLRATSRAARNLSQSNRCAISARLSHKSLTLLESTQDLKVEPTSRRVRSSSWNTKNPIRSDSLAIRSDRVAARRSRSAGTTASTNSSSGIVPWPIERANALEVLGHLQGSWSCFFVAVLQVSQIVARFGGLLVPPEWGC